MTRTLLQRTGSIATAFVLSISSLLTLSLSFSGTAAAAGLSCTWTGGGSDTNLSTAANWSNCNSGAPGANDTLVLPGLTGTVNNFMSPVSVTNDTPTIEFAGVTLSNTSHTSGATTVYKINNTIKLANNASFQGEEYQSNTVRSMLQDTDIIAVGNLSLSAQVASGVSLDVAGNLTATGDTSVGAGPVNVVGDLIINNGEAYLGAKAAKYVLSGSSTLQAYPTSVSQSYEATPIIINGNDVRLTAGAYGTDCVGACSTYHDTTITVPSPITLNGDLEVSVGHAKATLKLTGAITTNGHAIKESAFSTGKLVIGETAVETPPKTTIIDDEKENENLSVGKNETVVLQGKRGVVSVPTGILKGTGTATSLYVSDGGVVAPGLSPGTLTVVNTFTLHGAYQVEILNKESYDQLHVASASHTSGQRVTLGASAKLDLVLFDKYEIKKGDTFTIINNLQPASQKVNGTFSGLAEGATLSVGSASFSISYEGGDGNDVVLTALTDAVAPAAPNTGFAVITTNPIVTLAVTLGIAGFIALIALNQKSNRKAYAKAKSVRRK